MITACVTSWRHQPRATRGIPFVQIPTDSTFYAGFAALRSAFNTDEVKAWIMSKGMALDTVVVKPDSITGLV